MHNVYLVCKYPRCYSGASRVVDLCLGESIDRHLWYMCEKHWLRRKDDYIHSDVWKLHSHRKIRVP